MTVPYRVICADLVGNAIREELPIHDLKYTYVLNGAGTFSGWISMDDPKCTRANLDPGATAIYIERGGLLVWGGILWTAEADNSNRQLQLGGEGFLSYFKYRTIHNRTAMTSATPSSNYVFLPNGDGFTANVRGTVDNTHLYNNVNGQGPISNSTYIINNTVGAVGNYYANYNVPSGSLSGLTINSVRITVTSSSLSHLAAIKIRIAGTNYAPSDGNGLYVAPSPQPGQAYSAVWYTNPATGLPWTSADIDAFSSGTSAGIDIAAGVFPSGDVALYRLQMEVSWGAGGTALFANADQLAIARDLVNNMQAQPGSLTGIAVGSELTTDNGGISQSRSITYHDFEFKNLDAALTELAAMANGFDYSIEVAWSGASPSLVFRLYYPRRGRRIDGLVFNGNMEGISKIGLHIDATLAANSVHVLGAGEGSAQLAVTGTNTAVLSRYPLLESVVSKKDVDNSTTLSAYAKSALIVSSVPQELPSIEKQAQIWPDFGSFQVGDEALVRVQESYISIDTYERIQQISISLSDDGQEIMTPLFVSSDQVAI